jgi:hypothetical protein
MDFAVPAGSGDYAPEILYLRRATPDTLPAESYLFDEVTELQTLIAAIPATATVEVDVLKPNDVPGGTWRLAVQSWTTTGLKTILALAMWDGVRIRVKSGGTAGTATVDAAWWSEE